MSAHGLTRDRARQAAWEIAAEGRRPTFPEVRARLGGGGQKAIGDGLEDWLAEVVRRGTLPDVPDALRASLGAWWAQACAEADGRWADAKAALEGTVTGLSAARDTADAALKVAEARLAEVTDALDARVIELAQTRDALATAQAQAQHLEEVLAATTQELAQARSAWDEESRRRDHAERVAATAREGLSQAQERIARLQADQEVALARAELLERAVATAEAAAATARDDLASAQTQLGELRRTLSERDQQLATLAATVQAEQQGREADTQHWLERLEEHQVSVADYRAREIAWTEERKGLVAEVTRLRRERDRLAASPG